MRTMRVLYYHQYFSTPEGATGTRSYEMARRLVEEGHTVTMVCGASDVGKTGLAGEFRGGKRVGEVDGIKVVQFELSYSNRDSFLKRSVTFLRFALRSVKVAFTSDYDVLFATSTPLTAGIPGIAASYLRKKPFVFEVRDLWPELPREMGVITNPLVLKGMDVLEWLSYRAATRCIGLSPGIVEGIRRRGRKDQEVMMIPNGCDLDFFHPDAGEKMRPKGVPESDFLAVFSGAHGIANGLDAALDAAAELKKRRRNDIRFLFVGEGKLKVQLKERARAEGLDNCIFLDPIPKGRLACLLRGADVGLMLLDNVPAFYYGTSPNKFFDYIAAGLPVLNNYPGWLAELITHNKCGMAVPPESPGAFADALEQLANNSDQTREMGKNSRLLAEQEFDRRNLSEQFVRCLEEVVPG